MIKARKQQTSRRILGTFSRKLRIGLQTRVQLATAAPTICLRPRLLLLLLLIVFAGSTGMLQAQLNVPVVRGDNGLHLEE